ncbi:hypothetical protein [Flavobacterium psychrotrophum]|uniref:hypothetical protein n=1 Tax=Flavobacterium psychrotrophum TaxID=2294119 RepID=UPI000E31B0DD|nr:hypothetical protein [Flavobacterium psychrotrophum]
MEPNKIEQEFKQQLEQRSIAPSPMAWDRLDAMLTVAEQKAAPKKKANLGWMYMAACFLVLLSGGMFFFNKETKPQGTVNGNSVVEKSTQATQTETQPTQIIPVASQQSQIAETVKSVKPAKKVKNTVNEQKFFPLPDQKMQEAVAQTTVKEESPVVEPVSSKIKVDANALLASVEHNASKNNVAQNIPAVTRPNIKRSKIEVNANTLLTSVEGELDQSFRGKVINSLQKNYNTVKTAVATRNLQ